MVGPRAERTSFEARVRELVAQDTLIAGVNELIGAGYLATTTIGRRRLVLVRSLRTLLEANASQSKDA